jgi:peptide deformylase
MSPYDIRIIGDPVLKSRVRDVEEIDGSIERLVDDMLETMYAAPGIGLAANQIGVQRRLFVWDVGEGPRSIINPAIVESDGEWVFEEGCLSVPGLSWEIVRPKQVHVLGLDLDGNELSIEADELEARLFQHELDHLDGILLVERLDADTRKEALKTLRELRLGEKAAKARAEAGGGLRLP